MPALPTAFFPARPSSDSVITETVFLDTIPAKEGSEAARIKMLSVAPVFAEAISRIYEDKPVSPLFT